MKRYEYKVIDTGKHVEKQLNELGAQGWQVVGITTKKQLLIATRGMLYCSAADEGRTAIAPPPDAIRSASSTLGSRADRSQREAGVAAAASAVCAACWLGADW